MDKESCSRKKRNVKIGRDEPQPATFLLQVTRSKPIAYIYLQANSNDPAIGYMYEFDCKAEENTYNQPGWFAIAFEHQVRGNFSRRNCFTINYHLILHFFHLQNPHG